MLKTPLESVQWFQGYEQLKILRTTENNFFWLYLTINITDFRLIQLDRNTFVMQHVERGTSQHMFDKI